MLARARAAHRYQPDGVAEASGLWLQAAAADFPLIIGGAASPLVGAPPWQQRNARLAASSGLSDDPPPSPPTGSTGDDPPPQYWLLLVSPAVLSDRSAKPARTASASPHGARPEALQPAFRPPPHFQPCLSFVGGQSSGHGFGLRGGQASTCFASILTLSFCRGGQSSKAGPAAQRAERRTGAVVRAATVPKQRLAHAQVAPARRSSEEKGREMAVPNAVYLTEQHFSHGGGPSQTSSRSSLASRTARFIRCPTSWPVRSYLRSGVARIRWEGRRRAHKVGKGQLVNRTERRGGASGCCVKGRREGGRGRAGSEPAASTSTAPR